MIGEPPEFVCGHERASIIEQVGAVVADLLCSGTGKFADSSLEETVRCELVSAVGPDSRPDEYLESIKKGVERRFPASFVL